jgi:hypothetical protein
LNSDCGAQATKDVATDIRKNLIHGSKASLAEKDCKKAKRADREELNGTQGKALFTPTASGRR